MSTKSRIKMVTIPIDFSKTVGNPSDNDAVLLYDEAANCYYRASLSHVIGASIKAAEAKCAELQRQFDKEKAEAKASREEMAEKQKKFISDTNEIIKTIIDLVEGGTKNEGKN